MNGPNEKVPMSLSAEKVYIRWRLELLWFLRHSIEPTDPPCLCIHSCSLDAKRLDI